MICKNCGKVLKEYDKFCSNCGTIVEREQTEDFVFTAPQRDFEWDVHSFPAAQHQKTKDAVFDWGISEDEFRHRPRSESDSSFFESQKEPDVVPMKEVIIEPIGVSASKQEEKPAESEKIIPEEIEMPAAEPLAEQTFEQEVSESPDIQPEAVQQVFDEKKKMMKQPVIEPLTEEVSKPEEKKGFFARFSKDKDATLEQPAITDEQIEQARAAAEQKAAEQIPVQQEPEVVSEQAAEQELFEELPVQPESEEIIDPAEPFVEEQVIPEPEFVAPEEPAAGDFSEPAVEQQFEQESFAEEPVTDHVDFDWSQQPETPVEPEMEEQPDTSDSSDTIDERELFGGAAVAGIEGGGEELSRHSAKIDKFYVFNKRNEEFQKLLDEEYEKMREGKPLDNDLFAANVQAIKEANPEEGTKMNSDISGLADMADINDSFIKEPSFERDTMPYEIISERADEKLQEPEFIEKAFPEEELLSDELPPLEPVASEAENNVFEEITPAIEKPANEPASEGSFWSAAPSSGEFIAAQPAEQFFIEEQTEEPEVTEGSEVAAAEEGETEKEQNDRVKEIFGFGQPAGSSSATDGKTAEEAAPAKKEKVKKEKAKKEKVKNESSGTAGKVVIVILSVILALLLIALGIKLIAPDSFFAMKMDNIVDSFMQLFTGKAQSLAATWSMLIGG